MFVDSLVVVNIWKVGGVLFGCINFLMFVLCWFMVNFVYGYMCNLCNVLLMLGGLSGGVVVVVVVGIGLFVVGIDIGGLVCYLVYVCGVYGIWLLFGCVLVFNVLLFEWVIGV